MSQGITPIGFPQPLGFDQGPRSERAVGPSMSFRDTLAEYVRNVGELERTADDHIQAMARGEAVDPHTIMLALEEANLALDLLIELRNKLLEAYQELSRTPI